MPRKERPLALEPAAAQEKSAEEEERRRLLYVALTRAEDRLYVAGWLPRNMKEAPEDCWHSLVRRALLGMPGVEERPCGLGPGFDGPVLRYRSGGERREEAGPRPAPPTPVTLPAWLHRPAVVEPARRARSPSSLQEREPPARPPRSRREEHGFRRGRALHKLLELLPGLAQEEREGAAERLLRALLPELDADGRRRLYEEAERVMALPELAPLFAPGARAEQAVAGSLDGEPLVGVVDRFAVTDRTIHLADFKSHPEPPPPERLPAAYREQMRAYGRLLAALYPGRELRAAIVWTALPRVDLLHFDEA
ncbi:MAG TPA: hypothetical protein ENJ83_02200 [Rhodospirillales bacterium]|nr:hypothetical protein [Rhodospirillales bacterium]